mgnify:CR=1 FL=1
MLKMNRPDNSPKNSILIYTTEDGLTKIDTTFDGDTVWLSIDQMADLFQRDRSVIGKHIRNIFKEGELQKESVWAKFAYTAADGKTYDVDYYNLDVIISVGYRVKSKRGTQFRIWATGILKEYMRKGFALDDERLKNLGSGGYFKELLERIRDIRASEKVFYRQVLEIYATSIDYDPKAEISVQFFKKVQNKIHYAIHGQTAAEVIYNRADAEKEFMGLTTFAGNQPTLREATIAKNYLNEKELRAMGQLVSGYLDFAERQAEREQPMTMQDWANHLDRILTMSGERLLVGNGSVTHKQAVDKAREGRWNGGFAPYGYKLEKGQLFINEEEAAAIRVIFDQYVHTDTGANGLAKYLVTHGIHKIQRQNGKNPLFDSALIRRILKNPVYCGKIAYGRRRTEKVHGTRNDYRLVEQDDYLLVDGLHEGIVSEELWHEAQVKLLAQAEKYEHVNRGKDTKIHLLSGIVKCPVCGVGMYGNKSIKHKADGSKYKDFYYYGCKHRAMTRGHKCDFKKQINEELLDSAVAEVIVKLVSNPKFAAMMQEKISMKVDTSAIEQEIAAHEKQLRQSYSVKVRLMDEIDSLDPDDRHYIKRKADLDDRLYKMYDKIEDTENQLVAARAKKMAIEAEKLTGDNIYKVLIYFDKLYSVMDDQEKRQLMESLLSEVQIYEERQPNGQWLKSIKFKLPIIAEDMSLSLDNDARMETVVLLSKLNVK